MHMQLHAARDTHLQGSCGKLTPTITGRGTVLPDVPMGMLMGLTTSMRGVATMVILAEPNNTTAYPENVTARAQEAQGGAPMGTVAEMRVLLTTTHPESGSMVDAFWR
jgi:hypothetical protein